MTVDHKDVDGASTHPSAEYWIIDRIARQLRVVKAGVADVVVHDAFEWRPEGASDPLRFE